MYHVLSRIDVPAESRDEYIAIIRKHASESLQEERGTLTFDVIQDEENPNRFYVSEAYTDEAAFQAHMQGPVAQRNFPRLLPLIGDNFAFLGKGYTIGHVES